MDFFAPATRRWFESAFAAPTEVQRRGWERIHAGEHTLLIAPTGSGKTLAAFLYGLDRLTASGPGAGDAPASEPGVRVLYVSPLKALVYDIERNLRTPLAGIAANAAMQAKQASQANQADRGGWVPPRVDIRTGDTPSADRRRQIRDPGEILVTTPESLFLLLGSQARETLRTVRWVIVDEIHAMAATKRGAHLALSLERLSELADADPQRIGLSATARPAEEVARFLGGDRAVSVVDAHVAPELDLRVVVPVEDMTRPVVETEDGGFAVVPEGQKPSGSLMLAEEEETTRQFGIWPAVYPKILELILAHRTTIVFVNSRGLCERLAQRLNEQAGEELVRAHHGSLAHGQRKEIEEGLKTGELRGIVATSSLELGIDMGAVDLVVLVESPGSVASGLQRVGRAGHQVGETSIGRVFPKHRGDLLEAAVVAQRMREGAIEALRVPRNPLDVLAQHVVAMTAVQDWRLDDLARVLRRAANFRELPDSALTAVLDMLSGLYPSHDFGDLRPRLNWDRERDVLSGRRGARMLAAVNAGTIPDRGLYGVHLGDDGPRVGELDEEMVHESVAGQVITLGASTWRIVQITRDRVIVDPAPGEPGRLPFWKGEGPGRPLELGRALGAFVRELSSKVGRRGSNAGSESNADADADGVGTATGAGAGGGAGTAKAERWLVDAFGLDERAARNLVRYVEEQREATGTVPTDRDITVERFRDELGDWRVCILTPFGARVHAPWALALRSAVSARVGYDVQAVWSDDGIVLTLADGDEPPELDMLVPDAEEVEERVLEELPGSPLFASQFRENAARALLLPRRRPGKRTPLFAQRLRAQKLMGIALQYPSFPIVIETLRSCLQDVFDVPALAEVLRAVERREIRVHEVETPSASPFARSLVFAYVAAYLYEGDSPAAERRAQALSVDLELLRELLGDADLRELLDAGIIAEVEDQLQRRAEGRRARHPDELHDVLRAVGDLTLDEARERTEADPAPWLRELETARRAVRVRVAGRDAWIAVEDAGLYRDALGTPPPSGVASAFLEPVEAPVEALLLRWARTHGPFTHAEVASRYGLVPAQAVSLLERVAEGGRVGGRARGGAADGRDAPARGTPAPEAQGARLLRGAFRPGAAGEEWCDPEVLRQIKRRTIAKLRHQVAPVPREVLARFLPAWHRVSGDAHEALEDAIIQLEGIPLSYRELVRMILPARVPGFRPEHLDELGAMGWLVWVGHSPVRGDDGRIMLFRRQRVSSLAVPAALPPGLQARAAEARPTEARPAEAREPERSDTRRASGSRSASVSTSASASAFEAAAESTGIEGFDGRHARILSHLERRGASFHAELVGILGDVPAERVEEAVWDLVWAGLVTNDTFAALRSLGGPRGRAGRGRRRGRGGAVVDGAGASAARGAGGRRGRGRGGAGPSRSWRPIVATRLGGAGAGPGGRWSLVRDLVRDEPTTTERAAAWAVTLLERHGIVARETAAVEALGGGFSGVYRVLRSMEEAGKVRRGYFVEGLGGAQFAYPGIVDRLRRVRDAVDDGGEVVALAATDPANPYGWLLPWPELRETGGHGPRRATGAAVVLVDGEPALYVDRNGRRLRTFADATDEAVQRALPALRDVARGRPRGALALEKVDGESAILSRWTPLLKEAGFTQDYRAMRITAA